MVSNLHKANDYYQKQKKGQIAKDLSDEKRLQKDSKGFYLFKQNSKGEMFKQRVEKNDLVYSRNEGTTLYSKSRDRDKDSSHVSENKKVHDKKAHMSDRKGGNTLYKV